MNGRTKLRFAAVALILFAPAACASGSNAFDAADRTLAARQAEDAGVDRSVCPVVISNATDRQLEARYRQGGRRSMLGLIPAGRSVEVRVSCDAGTVEAVGVSRVGGLLSGGYEYRTTSSVNRSGFTRLNFKLTDRVR